MNMDSGQVARVVVGSVEAKNGIHAIIGTDGKRFSFFETTQDKTQETEQYIQYRKLLVKQGDVLDITFTPRSYMSKFGKQAVGFNLDRLERVGKEEAKAATVEAKKESIKFSIRRDAAYFLSSRLQAGATFDEVNREIGKAVNLASSLNDVVEDLFGEREEGAEVSQASQQLGYDGQPVPF